MMRVQGLVLLVMMSDVSIVSAGKVRNSGFDELTNSSMLPPIPVGNRAQALFQVWTACEALYLSASTSIPPEIFTWKLFWDQWKIQLAMFNAQGFGYVTHFMCAWSASTGVPCIPGGALKNTLMNVTSRGGPACDMGTRFLRVASRGVKIGEFATGKHFQALFDGWNLDKTYSECTTNPYWEEVSELRILFTMVVHPL